MTPQDNELIYEKIGELFDAIPIGDEEDLDDLIFSINVAVGYYNDKHDYLRESRNGD